MVLTFRLGVVYGPQNKQRLLPHTALTDWFCLTELESAYCAVRAESLYRVIKCLCAPDYSTKTRKHILNSFSHLP
jgi:hypothetical protein